MTTTSALLTAEEFSKLPDPGDGQRYELLNGEVRAMPPTGGRHGGVSGKVALRLGAFVEAHDLGFVLTNDPGVVLRRSPDRVRAPDVCFIERSRLPDGLPDGYLEIVPDLIVEVVSPWDSATEVQEKIEEWLRAGARLVWAFYPRTRSVAVYDSLEAARILHEGDTLEGGAVLPGFAVPVRELFG